MLDEKEIKIAYYAYSVLIITAWRGARPSVLHPLLVSQKHNLKIGFNKII